MRGDKVVVNQLVGGTFPHRRKPRKRGRGWRKEIFATQKNEQSISLIGGEDYYPCLGKKKEGGGGFHYPNKTARPQWKGRGFFRYPEKEKTFLQRCFESPLYLPPPSGK